MSISGGDVIKNYFASIIGKKGSDCANVIGDDLKISGGYAGTSGGMVGGIDDLTKEYDTTVSSVAKRQMIKKLSDGLSSALKVSPPGASASSDELVAHMIKIVPNPRKGRSIIADSSKQSKLCSDIADVINTIYGNKSIDVSLSPEGICNQVSDIIDSLSAGINQEYVAVAASVERSLHNIQDLKELLTRSYEKLYSEAANSDDDNLKTNMLGIKSMHDLIMMELQRQLAILSNLTGTVLSDNKKEISQLLAKNKDFKGLVASIKNSIGTSEWGDKLGFWLSGINTVAEMALQVDKALKDIGMKASDYKHNSKMSDLIMDTQKILEKLPRGKLTRDYIDKFEKAIEVLKKHHGHHAEIAKKIEGAYQSSGGACPYVEGRYEGGHIPLAKKLKTQDTTRKLLLKDFKMKTTILMDRVYQAIFKAGKRMGTGHIKLTDDLYRFKGILTDLTLVFTEGIEYALTGYYTHANAIEHKNRFLGLLKAMLMCLESLKSQDESFKEISTNVEAVISLVDFFNDKFKVYVGRIASERTTGAGEGGADGGGEFKAAVTLKNAKNTFNHFYSIAKFKTNLKVSSSEMKGYTEKYTTIVGSAVAKKIDSIVTANTEALKKLTESGATGFKDGLEILKIPYRVAIGLVHQSEEGLHHGEWAESTIKELLNEQVAAKKQLYRVAQAVDEYLQKFTDAIATSPDDIQEVSKLLGSVEIMANWFNEKSGDSIASLFEIFPWTIVGMRTFMNSSLQGTTCGTVMDGIQRTHIPNNSHYYDQISKHTLDAPVGGMPAITMANFIVFNNAPNNKRGMAGVPFFPISPARASFAKKFAKYTVEKIYVIKNLISAFTYLGNKFGGVDVSKETFMSPNDMYKSLCEYLYTSAFTHGWEGAYARQYGINSLNNGAVPDANPPPQYVPPMTPVGALPYHFITETTNNCSPSLTNVHNTVGAGMVNVYGICPYMSSTKIINSNDGLGAAAAAPGAAAAAAAPVITALTMDILSPGTVGRLRDVCRVRYNYSFAMAGIDDDNEASNISMSGWKNVFKDEDKIFIAIIKAMAAKVFTVTGLYNMLNFKPDHAMYTLDPIRLILGGGSSVDSSSYETPKIYPEAVELYARLPLLAEFYRDIFCFEDACNDDAADLGIAAAARPTSKHLLISMVPEVGSLWSSFIQIIFDQPLNTNGLYTDNVLKSLVHEINSIYQVYKDKDSFVQLVIADFVAEINSRYGLMYRGEIETYKKEENSRRSRAAFGDAKHEDVDDFDILDSNNMSSGVAPSDRYTSVSSKPDPAEYELNDATFKALKVFRRRIDKRVSDIILKNPNSQFDKRDFNDVPDFGRLIISIRDTLKNTDDLDNRYKIVSAMMISMDAKTQTDSEVSVMFHESIVTPLAVLTSITNMITNYQKYVEQWDAPTVWRSLLHGFKPNAAPADKLYGNGGAIFSNQNLGQIRNRLAEIVGRTNRSIIIHHITRARGDIFNNGCMGHGAADSVRVLCDLYYIHPQFQQAGNAGWPEMPSEYMGADVSSNQIAYMLIRWEAVFKNLINAVYGLTSDLDSMCEAQFNSNKGITINHTKLQMVCEEVFSTVRKNFDMFRGIIPNLNIYESIDSKGSISWLQENLFDNLFNDQDKKSGLKRSHRIVTESFMLLSNLDPDTGKKAHIWNLAATVLNVKTEADVEHNGWSVDAVMSELTHYNSTYMCSNTHNGSQLIPGGFIRVGPISNFSNSNYIGGVLTRNDEFSYLFEDPPVGSGARTLRPEFAARYDYYLQNTANGTTNAGFRGDNNGNSRLEYDYNKAVIVQLAHGSRPDTGSGLMMKFNEVMAKYISQFWDVTTLKMYSSLIKIPANGPMNQEVFKMLGWPDLARTAADRFGDMWNFIEKGLPFYTNGSNGFNAMTLLNNMDGAALNAFTGGPLDVIKINRDVANAETMSAGNCRKWAMLVKMSIGTTEECMNIATANTGIGHCYDRALRFQDMYSDELIKFDDMYNSDKSILEFNKKIKDSMYREIVEKHNSFPFSVNYGRPYTGGNVLHLVTLLNAFMSGTTFVDNANAANLVVYTLTVGDVAAWVAIRPLVNNALHSTIDIIRLAALAVFDITTTFLTRLVAECHAHAAEHVGVLFGGVGLGAITTADFEALALNNVGGAAAPRTIANSHAFLNASIQTIAHYVRTGADQNYGGYLNNAAGVVTVRPIGDFANNQPERLRLLLNSDLCKLMVPAFHLQMLRRLFIIKRFIIDQLEVNSDPDWLTVIRERCERYSHYQSNKSLMEEMKRLTNVMRRGNRRTVCNGSGNAVAPPNYELDASVTVAITTRASIIGQCALEIFSKYIEQCFNEKHTKYDVITIATVALEPIMQRVKEFGRASFDMIIRLGGLDGIDMVSTYRNYYKLAFNHRMALCGGVFESGTVDAYLGANPIAMALPGAPLAIPVACVDEFEKAIMHKFRPDLAGILTPPLSYSGAGVIVPAADGSIAFNANSMIMPYNALDGTSASITLMSRLLGAGISDVINTTVPHVVDVFDVRQLTPDGKLQYLSLCDEPPPSPAVQGLDELNPYHLINNLNFEMTKNLPPPDQKYDSRSFKEKDIPSLSQMGKGDPIHILFASLSKAIRSVLTEVTKTGIKSNSTESIAEVPIHIKESMKAQLPVFNEMFKLINKKANLLKGIIKLNIGLSRPAHENIDGEQAVTGVHGGTADPTARNQAAGKQWYTQFLDKITNACESMSTTIESVLNELNDAPLYLEVNESSITEYKNRYSKLPFMPISSMTMALVPSRNQPANNWQQGAPAKQLSFRNANLGYPDTSTGDPYFSFNYGTRLLLHDHKVKPMIDHMPGMRDIVLKYNTVAQGSRKVEEKTFGQYLGKVVELLRYTHNTKLFSTIFGAHRHVVDDSKLDIENFAAYTTYQMTLEVPSVIELTTGSDTDSNISSVVGHVNSKNQQGSSRYSSVMYNIMDLNISPINIHAMRREIPLINLFNYAHTFDSFITEIVQSSHTGVDGDDKSVGDDVSTHDVLSAICKNPYIRIPYEQFYGKLRGVVSGSSTIDVYGHPKFISDQLWNKVLLQHSVLYRGAGVVPPNARRRDILPLNGGVLPDAGGVLTYTADSGLKQAAVSVNSGYFNELGRLRFDTKFARNLMFLANVQRLMMHKINTELTSIPYPVASGPSVGNRAITDYVDHETYDDLSID